MVISHEYKYVFVEIPHTASTAISRELCENYKGEPILKKHSHLQNFLKIASPEERSFMVVAGMRNPMDVVVTRYYKTRTNHGNMFSDPKQWRENGGHVSLKERYEYRFIQERNADFAAYFQRFFVYPYDVWGCSSPDDFGFIIHYENLQVDFAMFLDRLKIPKVRPLPVVNKTSDRNEDFSRYYQGSARIQAARVFGPFLELWGYKFPVEWDKNYDLTFAKVFFRMARLLRKILIVTGFYYKAV